MGGDRWHSPGWQEWAWGQWESVGTAGGCGDTRSRFRFPGWWRSGGTPGVAPVPVVSPHGSLAPCRDLEQAAEAAIERKNEAEMSLVLSRCSAGTDSAVAEKLNRARAQLLKK